MIIIKLISGLGNQLFQYALGRQLALKKRVPLKLDLSFYTTQTLRSYRLNNFNIKAEIATEDDLRKVKRINGDISSFLYQRLQKYLPVYKRAYYQEKQLWGYDPQVFYTPKNVYIAGYWQNYKYFNTSLSFLFSEITPINSLITQHQELIFKVKSIPTSISVHVRRGDYVKDVESNKLFGVLPLEYYQQAIDYIAERIQQPFFLIFSDDIAWVKANLQIEYETFFVQLTNNEADCVELYLMSLCHHNIIANSTFSWWGAFLNQNTDKIVVSPNRWAIAEDINRLIEIQFPAWIKL